jgi:uncharacterized protein YuzE
MKRKQVNFEYDRAADAAYLTLGRGKIVQSEETQPGLILDFDAKDQIIGVEILRFSKRFLRGTRSRVADKGEPRKLAS